MGKEVISDRQSITLIILFIIGTASIQVMGLEAKQDLWIAIILAMIFTILILIVLGRLLKLFPGKNLFDICESILGKYFGKLINLLFIWYFFHAGASVLRNYYQFVVTTSLDETPDVIIMVGIFILCAWLVKLGIEVMGRWSFFLLALLIIFGIFSTTFLIKDMNIENLRPVLDNGLGPILEGAFSIFSFPLGELIAFTVILDSLQKKKSPTKIYIYGLVMGTMFLLIMSTTDILVLGVNEASAVFFPSYRAITRLKLGGFLLGMEIVAASLFTIGAFIKICIYLLATCLGLKKLFNYKDYRFIVIPVSLLMINLSYFLHDNIVEYFNWNEKVWKYYAFPFQAIIPIILLIISEIRNRLEYK